MSRPHNEIEEDAALSPAGVDSTAGMSEDLIPAGLELAYQAEMDRMRMRRLGKTALVAVALYAAFAISDRTMVPDVYRQAWAIRFLLVIPYMLAATFVVYRVRQPVLREVLIASSLTLTGFSLTWIAAMSSHPNALHYQTGITLIILFGNIVLNQRLRSAVAVSTLLTVAYAFSLLRVEQMTPEVRFNSWLFCFSAVVISLIANFRMDQDQRRAFLARAREHERNQELSHAVELLGKLSAEDALTQIANRREFDRRLEIEWGRARRDGQTLAVIMIDIDCFKNYNDYYGHPAGDACLQRIAGALRAIPKRSADLVARFGGEEFVVLLPATTLDDAAALAERLRQAVLGLRIVHADSTVAPSVTASLGVAAASPSDLGAPGELVAAADAALYRAKEGGRNRVVAQAVHARPVACLAGG